MIKKCNNAIKERLGGNKAAITLFVVYIVLLCYCITRFIIIIGA